MHQEHLLLDTWYKWCTCLVPKFCVGTDINQAQLTNIALSMWLLQVIARSTDNVTIISLMNRKKRLQENWNGQISPTDTPKTILQQIYSLTLVENSMKAHPKQWWMKTATCLHYLTIHFLHLNVLWLASM